MLVNRSDRGFVYPMLLLLASLMLLWQFGCSYFPESTFELSPQSRSPKWITLPQGLKRSEVSLSMSYYTLPSGGKAEFTLRDGKKHVLQKVTGQTCGGVFPSATSNPAYQVVVVRGVPDVIEHKAMEPIFYVTDDAVVWRQAASLGCF